MTSINFNSSATTALRTLQQTNNNLSTTQNRIATGLKIGEAKDNAAYWAISTTLKSDNKSLATVKDALGLGAATVDVAYQGLNKAKDVLDEIKSKLTAATQAGVDRSIIQAEISALQDQLSSIASSSTFSGENWLSVNSSVAGYNNDKQIVASFSRDAGNSVSIGTIGVDISKVALFDAGASGTGIVDASIQLKDSTGANLAFGGVASTSGTTSTGSISNAGFAAGTGAAGNATNAGSTAFVGASLIFDDVADVLSFDVAVDGAATPTTVTIRRGTVQNALNDSSNSIAIATPADLVKVTQQALSDAGVTGVTVGLDTSGFLSFTSTASLPATAVATRGVAVTNAAFVNTAGTETTTAIVATDFNTGVTAKSYVPASVKLGKFVSPITFTGDATIKFSLNVNGAGAVDYTIDKAAVSAALGTTDGKVNTASELQQVIISVIEADPTYDVGFAGTDELLVGALSDGTLTFTSRGTTATSAIAVALATGETDFATQDSTAVTTTTGTSSISVDQINITDAGLKATGATDDGTSTGNLDGAKVLQAITAYISVVNEAITKVTSAASNLGAVASRIDLQDTFVSTLIDTIDKGVSGLIDADLSEESTKLQALQTKQQLGIQALSIANSSQQNILRLFQ
jgi:flagellin